MFDYSEANLDRYFANLEASARDTAAAIRTPEELENLRLAWMGRKQGLLHVQSSQLLKLAPAEAKKPLGQRFNALKALLEKLLDQAAGAGPSDEALASEAIDITLPGTRRLTGAEHPITRTLNEITAVFAALVSSVGVGPEV